MRYIEHPHPRCGEIGFQHVPDGDAYGKEGGGRTYSLWANWGRVQPQMMYVCVRNMCLVVGACKRRYWDLMHITMEAGIILPPAYRQQSHETKGSTADSRRADKAHVNVLHVFEGTV